MDCFRQKCESKNCPKIRRDWRRSRPPRDLADLANIPKWSSVLRAYYEPSLGNLAWGKPECPRETMLEFRCSRPASSRQPRRGDSLIRGGPEPGTIRRFADPWPPQSAPKKRLTNTCTWFGSRAFLRRRQGSVSRSARLLGVAGSWSSSSAIWLCPHGSGLADFPHPALPGSIPHYAARCVQG